MKELPIGIQAFGNLIRENYLYVDKSKEIHKLVAGGGKFFFLSRPRRFGKSLLVSTLKELFSGNRELFKDLWIYDRVEWKTHPVIHMDFLGLKYGNREELAKTLNFLIDRNAAQYGIRLKTEGYDQRFKELIGELSQTGEVVVLIDEYDKPIIENIENRDIAEENRIVLRTFYETLKESGGLLRFVFITGVSKFSKVSIFSGLNNLIDITLDADYATLLGYTENELSRYFGEAIDALSVQWGVGGGELREKVRRWYNGYSWDGQNRLYNPVSVHSFISRQEFANYWFATATPTFLIKLIREKETPVPEFENIEMEAPEFDSYDVDNIGVTPLLFQTGYLTVSKVDVEVGEKTYYLSYPNKEVRESFLKHLLRSFSQKDPSLDSRTLRKLRKSLTEDDLETFFEIMQALFASLSYDMRVRDREGYYQTVIYLILTLTGIDTGTEVQTNRGRLDAVIETGTHIYVMEYKLDGNSADQALAQIKEMKYYQKYAASGKTVKIVGIGIDGEARNIGRFLAEEV